MPPNPNYPRHQSLERRGEGAQEREGRPDSQHHQHRQWRALLPAPDHRHGATLRHPPYGWQAASRSASCSREEGRVVTRYNGPPKNFEKSPKVRSTKMN